MKTILSKPNYSAQLGKNAFDCSHFLRFSTSTGQLQPVLADEVYPNDHIVINPDLVESLTILKMNSGSFARAKGHLEFFFVPLRQLFTPFTSFIYGVDDLHSSVFAPDGDGLTTSYSGKLPYFSAKDLQDLLNSYNSGVQASEVDEYGEKKINNVWRLLELLGYGRPDLGVTPVWSENQRLNPFRLAAYQKIFYDYYRNTDWTENDVSAYNLDQFFGTSANDNTRIPYGNVEKLFQMHYRPWAKDYYNNISPEPLMSVGSLNALASSFDLTQVNQWLSTNANALYITDPSQSEDSPFTQVINSDLNSPVDINTSFAVQKLLEKTRRAPKHYDKQTLAHFGIEPRDDNRVMYLGEHTWNIDVKDVVATAQTEVQDEVTGIGAIGGRGYGLGQSNRNIVDFNVPEHGIIMCIFSIEPFSDYSVSGIEKQNTYNSRFDYFIPELDNLGQVPFFRNQVKYIPQSLTEGAAILGWTYAFSESKVKFDRVAGNLLHSAQSWIPRRDNVAVQSTNSRKFYIDPSYFDPLFAIKYLQSDRPNMTYATDPFECQIHFTYQKRSVMSKYSLLNL